MNVQRWCQSKRGEGTITGSTSIIVFWISCNLLPYRVIRRRDISWFCFFFTMHLSSVLVLDNAARTLPVDFLLGSEAKALTPSSSFPLLHCPTAGGCIADAWVRRCEGAWVVPVCLLHWVHVRSASRVMPWAWPYEALRRVPLGGSGGGVAVLRRRAKHGGCAVVICTCDRRRRTGR